jgi:hypothetical protein
VQNDAGKLLVIVHRGAVLAVQRSNGSKRYRVDCFVSNKSGMVSYTTNTRICFATPRKKDNGTSINS